MRISFPATHRYLFPLILLLVLLFTCSGVAAKIIYLPKLSFRNGPVVEKVFKDVIHKCDSTNGNNKYIFEVGLIEKGGRKILLDFSPKTLKLLYPTPSLRGFTVIDNRYFFIYEYHEPKNIIFSTKKYPFRIKENLDLMVFGWSAEWFYLIDGETYKNLTFDEFSELEIKFYFR